MKILVTGCGGDIGQSTIKCLDGFEVFGCDTDFFSSRIGLKKFYESPTNPQEYLTFIKRMTYEVDYIIPTSETEINLIRNSKGRFLITSPPLLLDTFFNKYQTIQFLKEHNFPYPITLDKFILKKRHGYGSKELIRNTQLDEDYIVQEYIGTDDEEYTIIVFSDGTDTRSITFKRRLGYGSLSKVIEYEHNPIFHKLSHRLASICSLRGVLNIQCRKRGDEYIIFEINPRLTSTVYFRHLFGFKDVLWWIEMLENKKLSPYEFKNMGIGVVTLNQTFL